MPFPFGAVVVGGGGVSTTLVFGAPRSTIRGTFQFCLVYEGQENLDENVILYVILAMCDFLA